MHKLVPRAWAKKMIKRNIQNRDAVIAVKSGDHAKNNGVIPKDHSKYNKFT